LPPPPPPPNLDLYCLCLRRRKNSFLDTEMFMCVMWRIRMFLLTSEKFIGSLLRNTFLFSEIHYLEKYICSLLRNIFFFGSPVTTKFKTHFCVSHDVIQSFVSHGAFIHVTLHIHVCDTCVAVICVAWRIYMCGMLLHLYHRRRTSDLK